MDDPGGGPLRRGREHEMVDGSEERRERFSGAGRREDEHALAIRYCGPGELLRACRRLECRLEPGSRRRIEAREQITPHEAMLRVTRRSRIVIRATKGARLSGPLCLMAQVRLAVFGAVNAAGSHGQAAHWCA